MACQRLRLSARLGQRRHALARPEPRASDDARDRRGGGSWDEEDLSLSANAVYVNEEEERGGAAEGPTTSGASFGCDLQENLFHVNVGKAVTTIRDELPHVLERDLSYDIYTEDVSFVDELSPTFGRNSKTTVGRESFKRAAFGIRFHTWLFFSRAEVDVSRVWQPHEDVIAVRWTFRGLPRIIGSAFPGSSTYVDGISEFKLNRQGLVYQVKVDNLDKGPKHLAGLQDLSRMLARGGLAAEGSWPTASYLIPVPVETEDSVFSSYSEDQL